MNHYIQRHPPSATPARRRLFLCALLAAASLVPGCAPLGTSGTATPYPVNLLDLPTTPIWVATDGVDTNNGSEKSPFRTVKRALQHVRDSPADRAYRIYLRAGTYTEDVQIFDRRGTSRTPLVISSAPGRSSSTGEVTEVATLVGSLNIKRVSHLYLLGGSTEDNPYTLIIDGGQESESGLYAGNVVQCEECEHFLIRHARLRGNREGVELRRVMGRTQVNQAAGEVLKVNQSQHVYVEDSDIGGAAGENGNAIDFVAVQYGHILNNKLHDAVDWCAYVKGGSAHILVEGNEMWECGWRPAGVDKQSKGGFAAGEGTGLQFMTGLVGAEVRPWLHYEAYFIRVVNNVVHHVPGAGFSVQGGYNVVFAFNTLYRIGEVGQLLAIGYGQRSCDPDGNEMDTIDERLPCRTNLDRGAWGTTRRPSSDNYVRIPNRHVYVVNNVFYNPSGYRSRYQQFSVDTAYERPWNVESSVEGDYTRPPPSPVYADHDLRIVNNLVWNGDRGMLILGGEGGCTDAPAVMDPEIQCTLDQIGSENQFLPSGQAGVLTAPECGNFTPAPDSPILSRPAVAVPEFIWDWDARVTPSPPGPDDRTTQVIIDRSKTWRPTRATDDHPGAYTKPSGERC